MSGGKLLTMAMLETTSVPCTSGAHRCQFAVLNSLHPGFMQFVYDIGCEAALPSHELKLRSIAAVMFYAAAQLADDLSDGECRYLRNPLADGPVTLMMLLNCGWKQVQKSSLSKSVRLTISDTMRVLMMTQLRELHLKTWSYTRTRSIAQDMGGDQMKICFQLLLAGTPIYNSAMRSAPLLGFALHVATDKMHGDRRFYFLPTDKRKLLVDDACLALKRIRRMRSKYIKTLADTIYDGLNSQEVHDSKVQ